MPSWASQVLRLLVVAALVGFEDWVALPSCAISRGSDDQNGGFGGGELKVMMVADLMLLGSDSSYADLFFRDLFMSKFFTKSIEKLKPDMLVVLGDISAKGWELTESKWIAVLQQFDRMLGSSARLPLHVVFGDRDIGECSKLDGKFVSQMASHLPGLDSGGCSAFEIGNVSFVSLNAVALLCVDNVLRNSIEKVVERKSLEFQTRMHNKIGEPTLHADNREYVGNFHWKQNDMISGSGPVVLLHFPLYRSDTGNKGGLKVSEENPLHDSFVGTKYKYSEAIGVRPYDLAHTLPSNVTEYILQALKPRIVFDAHAHSFSDRTHSDGTREITVPAMSWTAGGRPGFVTVTFGGDTAPVVRHCTLASEGRVLVGYVFLFILLLVTTLTAR